MPNPALLLVLAIAAGSDGAATKGAAAAFEKEIKPLLEARCQPCHFTGGKLYDRLPFDRAETVRSLGVKLFTRLKDEPSRAVIRKLLETKP